MFSIVALIGFASLWVRSYRHTDELYCERTDYIVGAQDIFDKHFQTSNWWVWSSEGGVFVGRECVAGRFADGSSASETELERGYALDQRSGRWQFEDRDWPIRRRFTGFVWLWDAYGAWMVRVPMWGLLVMSGLLPAARVASARRRARARRVGFCVACGYDLRATPERCPECGRVTDLAQA
ncbi:MAG TPA: hypothetical protein VH475_24755 [Tepidisphaeraceae bacterium]